MLKGKVSSSMYDQLSISKLPHNIIVLENQSTVDQVNPPFITGITATCLTKWLPHGLVLV